MDWNARCSSGVLRGSLRIPVLLTSLVGQERVTNPKERLRGRLGFLLLDNRWVIIGFCWLAKPININQ